MTPQERDLITTLLERLRSIGAAGQPKDREADGLIRQAMREQPDMPYYLIQTVLIQDLSLTEAQNRIADLEEQLAGANTQGSSGTSFLGSLFGQREPSAPAPARTPGPSAGPWGRGPQGQPEGAGYGRPPGYAQQGPGQQLQAPGQQAPGQPAPGGMMGGGGGFLRSAAATAAGVAGGALLFQGISSLFGQGYANSLYSGGGASPGLSESAAGNQSGDYGSDNGGDAGYSGGGPDEGGDYGGGGDYDGGADYGGGDFGSDNFC